MPVHVNRLKMAYVRTPEPANYLQHSNDINTNETDTTESTLPDPRPIPSRKSTRVRRCPVRLKDYVCPNTILGTSSLTSDNNGMHKIKRVLAKKSENNTTLYLVQIKGEPAQNSIWVTESDLTLKAKDYIRKRPPPEV